MNYLFKANLALIGFYLLYRLLFAKETFFTLNRIYLLGTVGFSLLFPLIKIGTPIPTTYTHWLPTVEIGGGTVQDTIVEVSKTSLGNGLAIVYFIGVIIFAGSFMLSLFRLYQFYKNTKRTHIQSRYRIYSHVHSTGSFSIFNHIFLNIAEAPPMKDLILQHELVHVRQWHSVDIILMELLKIAFWFNPVVYLYSRAVRATHEFIADEQTAKKEGSQVDYSKILLAQVFGVTTPVLSNSFFHHKLLKQRIMMLNKSKSTKRALLRYFLVLPIISFFILGNNLAAVERLKPDKVTAPAIIHSKTVGDTIPPVSHSSKDTIYKVVTEMPRFAGCEDLETRSEKTKCAQGKMLHFIYENIVYPAKARKDGVQGTVVISFVIQKDGSISDARIVRSIGGGCDEEALRVVNTMPNWIPGKEKGEPVPVQFNLPIRFKLD